MYEITEHSALLKEAKDFIFLFSRSKLALFILAASEKLIP